MQISKAIKNLGKSTDFDSRSNLATAAIGVVSGAKTNLLASCRSFVLAVTADGISATRLAEDLRLYGKNAVVIPSKEEVLLYNKAFSREETFQRTAALYEIVSGKADVAVISLEALCRRFPDCERFTEAAITLKKDRDYNIDILAKKLIFAGYKRENIVENKGQFAVRGDILDVFPVNANNPVRIDFFDTVIEKIKYFDTESGKSFDEIPSIEIAPSTDIFIYEDEVSDITDNIKKSLASLKLSGEYKDRAADICGDVISRVENGGREYSLSFVMPFLKGDSGLRQYLPQNTLVMFDDWKLLSDKLFIIYKEHETRFTQLLSFGEVLKESYNQYADKTTVFTQFEGLCLFTVNALNTDTFYKAETIKYNTTQITRYSLKIDELKRDISNWLYGGYKVFVCCGGEEGKKELEDAFYGSGITFGTDENKTKNPVLLFSSIREGFVSHENKFVLIGYLDVFLKKKPQGVKRKKKDVFLSPEIGDYIVHDVHGIGVCKGIKNLKTGSTAKDYIVIEYQDGDILYVPCDQMELIAKYSGFENQPKLNRLGGKEFEKVKQRVKNYIKEMAFDLKKLYAEREEHKGYAFSPDSPMQEDFENAFEFEETDDQLKSIAEIKKDMESPVIMDRLLCGDVGYGKTEVALRAAFKAVIDGKQVAFLCPTTILSQQHYNLCEKRFSAFGIRVDVLNRFKTKTELETALIKLYEGKTDIIIGTHRLLSADVKFKDLGLLIVDEEQRFGVESKEKIKNINKKVDVLTLTATPIPRTLHMSLSGIRDISVLDTPPHERLPVQTYVLEYSEALIADAINRELYRGGQAFILYNRVESIESFANKVRRAAPQARIITAHGQMKEDSLETAIERFYNGEADVLICTTIIENGIDIPNVNTMIVYESDRLGLSQLYQLRGRVGRGNRLAHVYFTYIPEKTLTENAYKRLKAIMEYTEFGSGFKIAMRDLEIRGAGNVLGKQQHGHIENVGYDMYLRLLKQSLAEGSAEENADEITADIVVDAYIPEKYIEDDGQRLKVYQKISSMELDEKDELETELIDIFGNIPQPVKNLINIRIIKLKGAKLKAESITLKHGTAKITFKSIDILKNDNFLAATEKYAGVCSLSFGEKTELVFSKKYSGVKMLELMTEFAYEAAK